MLMILIKKILHSSPTYLTNIIFLPQTQEGNISLLLKLRSIRIPSITNKFEVRRVSGGICIALCGRILFMGKLFKWLNKKSVFKLSKT